MKCSCSVEKNRAGATQCYLMKLGSIVSTFRRVVQGKTTNRRAMQPGTAVSIQTVQTQWHDHRDRFTREHCRGSPAVGVGRRGGLITLLGYTPLKTQMRFWGPQGCQAVPWWDVLSGQGEGCPGEWPRGLCGGEAGARGGRLEMMTNVEFEIDSWHFDRFPAVECYAAHPPVDLYSKKTRGVWTAVQKPVVPYSFLGLITRHHLFRHCGGRSECWSTIFNRPISLYQPTTSLVYNSTMEI